MREWGAVCVTGAADVIEMLTPLGEPGVGGPLPVPGERPGSVQEGLWPGPLSDSVQSGTSRTGVPDRQRRPLLARAALDALTIDVLEAIPARGAGPATIAVAAGLSVDAVVRSLGLLAAGGYVERCARGWRIRPTPVG